MSEDPEIADSVGKFAGLDATDLMISVGERMKPVVDPITQALGLKIGGKGNDQVVPPPSPSPSSSPSSFPSSTSPPSSVMTKAAIPITKPAASPPPIKEVEEVPIEVQKALLQRYYKSVKEDDAKKKKKVEIAQSTSAELNAPTKTQPAPLSSTVSVRDVNGDIMKQSLVLRRELEATVLKDIDSADEGTLRTRVTQLASDLYERISEEDIKGKHSIQQVENDLESKYVKLMLKQRAEADLELQRLLLEKEKESFGKASKEAQEMIAKYEQQFNSAIKAQAEGFRNHFQKELDEQGTKIRNDMQETLMHEVATIRKSQTDVLMGLQPKIDELSGETSTLGDVASTVADLCNENFKMRAASAALLSIETNLTTLVDTVDEKHNNATAIVNLTALTKLCKDDDLSLAVLNALPQQVLKDGVSSIPELQQKFRWGNFC